MNFASDNTGPAHPKVMEALMRANDGASWSYGSDPRDDRSTALVREVFEAPEAAVYFVPTGTAANALILATLAQPWSAIFCHRTAHVEADECNAPEFYAWGAKLHLVDGADGKMTAAGLRATITGTAVGDVHTAQRGPVSITQATEMGTAYTLEELSALTAVAKGVGLDTHLDGARFANAAAHLGGSAAEMSWKAGIDAVSFGGTKNGLLGAEAVVFFDPKHAWEFELRRKRGAHLFSKHRFLSAQMEAYLTDGLWLDMASRANAAAQRLATGIRAHPDGRLLYTPGANMLFVELPRGVHKALKAGGVQYNYPPDLESGDDSDLIRCRWVCDWSKTEGEIDRFLTLMSAG